MNLKRQILTLIMILAFVSSNAKIVTWSISPNYQELKRFYGDTYLFQNNGKWGIVSSGDNVILPANYDFITPFVNGYALIGSKEGSRLLLECIIGEDGNINFLNDKYYLPKKYQYVSENKLAVSNKNGKYGYINTSGEIVVKCQFDDAYPFKEGYAPILQGDLFKFISERYDRNNSDNMLRVEFKDGEITEAGCFSRGLAPVAYNDDFALINTSGKKVRKLKEADFDQTVRVNNAAPCSKSPSYTISSNYVEYSENGKYGLKQGDNIIVTPQFDLFHEKYSDGVVLASLNGKQGLLRISDGEVSVKSKVNGVNTAELEVDRKGNIQPITFECSVPGNLNNYRILLDEGNGQLTDKTYIFNRSGNTFSLSIAPTIIKNAENCDTRIVVENAGIILADERQHFSVTYPIKLRVSAPGPSLARANEHDIATVSSTIYNDSKKPVTVTATWSNGKISSVSIPANGSKTVSTTFEVPNDFSKIVSISLSTGERASSLKPINFKTFF